MLAELGEIWTIGGDGRVKHVLLISIDGMHALDFANCARGIAGINGGAVSFGRGRVSGRKSQRQGDSSFRDTGNIRGVGFARLF
jgi:hypothetical protein